MTKPENIRKKDQVLWRIYAILYSGPKTRYAVSNEIYHKPIPSVSDTIEKYTQEGYFKKIIGRDKKIKFISTSKPIVEIIEYRNKLNIEEKATLIKFLESKSFRVFIGGNKNIKDLNTIMIVLCLLSVNALCLSQYLFYQGRTIYNQRSSAMRDSKKKFKKDKRLKVEEELMNILRSKVRGYQHLFKLPNEPSIANFDYDSNEILILDFCNFNDELLLKIARSLNIYDVLVQCIAYAYETVDLVSHHGKGSFRQKK